jgi:hypothetical protein
VSGLLGRVMRTGLRRGMSGSRPWLLIGIAAGTLRVVRRLVTERETVYRAELKTGEGIEIRVAPPEG